MTFLLLPQKCYRWICGHPDQGFTVTIPPSWREVQFSETRPSIHPTGHQVLVCVPTNADHHSAPEKRYHKKQQSNSSSSMVVAEALVFIHTTDGIILLLHLSGHQEMLYHGSYFHPHPDKLQLAEWRLKGNDTWVLDTPAKLPMHFWPPENYPQFAFTIPNGRCFTRWCWCKGMDILIPLMSLILLFLQNGLAVLFLVFNTTGKPDLISDSHLHRFVSRATLQKYTTKPPLHGRST